MMPGKFIRPNNPNPNKNIPYECASKPTMEAVGQRSVKYFRYAILFVVFDVEVIFLYAWALIAEEIGLIGFIELSFFILVLLLGLAFAWKKRALEWG
ncbi:MAG: NADH dehydrogenase subunit A [Candidatus Methanohalarchaeum thermophilum]|uniref:NADH dehydrogenase subunit A n=1 Tax=Methanohalarchaeum thermophilum TaxID=1903181 RepID=A0A1Q6DX89_METT1|nr:MAG: NADH dehydrogenase subunit A [Candidatus Methanohalarchaeum thermophilum]